MKKIFGFLFVAAMVLSGCFPDSPITGPQETINKYSWVETPSNTASLAVERSFETSENINGAVGGNVALNESYFSHNKPVVITANLFIPQNAFSGTKKIKYVLNDKKATINFGPNMVFAQDLVFDLRIEGIDFDELCNTTGIVFAYLDGSNNIVPCEYESLTVDAATGTIAVKKAKINHFSRYGFAK